MNRRLHPLAIVGLLFAIAAPSVAAPITWIGGNVDWVDGGSTANWNPADEPDSNDEAIFNTANGVSLGSNNAVNGLTMSGGIDLSTNGFALTVDGLVQTTGASTNLFIGGATGSLNADNVAINGGAVELTGGLLTLDEEVGTSNLDIATGGTLSGHGVITFADTPLAFTTVFSNDGTLTALSRPTFVFNPPPVGSLQINTSTAFELIDLDGAGNAGVVNVNRNQTLDVNGTIADAFGGTMVLRHNSRLDMSASWGMNGGTLTASTGFVAGGLGVPDTPADVATIAGGMLTQTGGVISVADTDGKLQFDAPFTMNGGTLTNNGHVVFNNSTTINNAATFTMGTSGADLTVGVSANVAINQPSFNLDGNAPTTTITVQSDGLLELDLGDYDNDAVTNAFDGVVTLNSGDISVQVTDAEFVMDGTLNMNATTPGQIPAWSGDPLDVGNDSGVLDADVNVTGGIARIQTQVDFNSDADVNIATGAELQISGTAIFQSVNGANNAEFTGAGEFVFNGQVDVLETTTINMTGGTVDLDGVDGIGDFINVDAPLTINAATIRNFGRVNGGGGMNTLDVNNSVGTGVLTVNLDDPAAEWTLNGPGVMNLVNDNAPATLLAGSAVNVNGTLNVTGDVRSTARLDIAGVVNIATAAEPLRLAGGGANVETSNHLLGGTINGPGVLGADAGKNLIGFGSIGANIDFDGLADLIADDGMLTISGSILDVGVIGALDDGILNVVNPWNSGVAVTVLNQVSGEIRGGTITIDNPNGVIGKGLVSARIINNTRIGATRHFVGDSGTHVFQTAGNDNDWDGAAGAGTLLAEEDHTLELRDNATFGFTGTVDARPGGRVFANGFALDFNPGSTISLTNGTYESTSSTDIGGTVTVGAGADSTIKVQNNFFLTLEAGSSTTLNSNLHLQNNNVIVEAGATFSGTGALIIDESSHAVLENGAAVNVLLANNGTIRPSGFNTVGAETVKDYQQSSTGLIEFELTGTLLNQFDRLLVAGNAILDGSLVIDIDGAFVPALNQTFDILSATFGRSGTFDTVDVSGMPAGLAFHVNYLPNGVQLQVVNKPIFTADFDDDGDVDATDLAIWRNAYNLNQLGDATGDNVTNGADFLVWQRQFGSAPALAVAATNAAHVPEPACGALALIACMAIGVGRRVRRPAKSLGR